MPLKSHQIENWALKIIDRVNTGQPIEDFRVELKSEWISPEKAARRIAGHANASRGAPILWIIGVDEKDGVVGVNANDLADWFSGVESQFDGFPPNLTDINISIDGKIIVALYFETDGIPYVVKNVVHGQPGGGAVSLEVPWRKGTSTRSANRNDLIRLLSPLAILPEIEVLRASLSPSQSTVNGVDTLYMELQLDLYIEPQETGRIVIPFHRCSAEIEIPSWLNSTKLDSLALYTPSRLILQELKSESVSRTIEETRHELIVYGPGKAYLRASTSMPFIIDSPQNDANISVRLLPTNSNIPVLLNETLEFLPGKDDKLFRWEYEKSL